VVGVTLKRQHGDYTIAQLPVLSPIPSWCDGAGFVSVSRGDDELSVMPKGSRACKSSNRWRLAGTLSLTILRISSARSQLI